MELGERWKGKENESNSNEKQNTCEGRGYKDVLKVVEKWGGGGR
jgi:hypothetical protein